MEHLKQFDIYDYEPENIWDFDIATSEIKNFMKESNLTIEDMQEIRFIVKEVAYKTFRDERTQEFYELAQEKFDNDEAEYDFIRYFKEFPFKGKYLSIQIQLGLDYCGVDDYCSHISISDIPILDIKKQLQDKFLNGEYTDRETHVFFPQEDVIVL